MPLTSEEILSQARSTSQRASELLQSAQIKADEIKPSPMIDVSNLPTADTKSVESLVSSTGGLAEYYQKLYSESIAKEKAYKEQLATLGEKPTANVADFTEKAQAEFQVPEWLSKTQEQSVKVAKLQADIDKLNVRQQQEIDRTREQMANVPTYIIERQENKINREYASQKAYMAAELGGEAALLQAYAGNLGEARSLAEQAVNAYTYDLQQQRADYDNLFNYYNDWIQSLDKEQQNILSAARDEAITTEETAKQDKMNIMELKLKYPSAGINISDSLETAYDKASYYAANVQEGAEWSNGSLIPSNIAKSSGEKAVIDLVNSGITEPTTLYDLVNYDEVGNKIRNLDLGDINTILKNMGTISGKPSQMGIISGEQSQWEYDANIWQWLATEGAGLSPEEQKQQIMEAGRNPFDFGI